MNKNSRKELRAMVRTMYDYQDMRIRTAGRIPIDANENPIDTTHMAEAEISEKDYSTIEYVRASTTAIEKRLAKDIEKFLKSEPIYNEFFLKINGCGHLMAGVCLSEFDIHKADTVSKMWQFAGLNPAMVKGKKITTITEKTDMSKILREYTNGSGERKGIIETNDLIKGDKLTPGFVSPYNAYLRTKLCGVLAGNMIKNKGRENSNRNYAVEFYYSYKQRLENSSKEVMHLGKMVAWKDVTKGHRDAAAKRYMIKMFIADLYDAWRKIEGLPVRVPYQEEYLGHVHKVS